MNQDQQSSPDKHAEEVLKEANQKLEGQNDVTDIIKNDQPSSDEAADQIKGSDADADQLTGQDEQPSTEEAAEQVKGSDADKA